MANSMWFFPKWTTALPGVPMLSDPFEVTPYKTVAIRGYCSGFIGPGPLALQVEGSEDLGPWDPLGAALNLAAAGGWVAAVVTDPPRYLRITATSPGGSMTFFAMGVGREN